MYPKNFAAQLIDQARPRIVEEPELHLPLWNVSTVLEDKSGAQPLARIAAMTDHHELQRLPRAIARASLLAAAGLS